MPILGPGFGRAGFLVGLGEFARSEVGGLQDSGFRGGVGDFEDPGFGGGVGDFEDPGFGGGVGEFEGFGGGVGEPEGLGLGGVIGDLGLLSCEPSSDGWLSNMAFRWLTSEAMAHCWRESTRCAVTYQSGKLLQLANYGILKLE